METTYYYASLLTRVELTVHYNYDNNIHYCIVITFILEMPFCYWAVDKGPLHGNLIVLALLYCQPDLSVVLDLSAILGLQQLFSCHYSITWYSTNRRKVDHNVRQ